MNSAFRKPPCAETRSPLPGSAEELLWTEVDFWRRLIAARTAENPAAPELERMRHALALAEFRLRQQIADESKGADRPAREAGKRKRH